MVLAAAEVEPDVVPPIVLLDALMTCMPVPLPKLSPPASVPIQFASISAFVLSESGMCR